MPRNWVTYLWVCLWGCFKGGVTKGDDLLWTWVTSPQVWRPTLNKRYAGRKPPFLCLTIHNVPYTFRPKHANRNMSSPYIDFCQGSSHSDEKSNWYRKLALRSRSVVVTIWPGGSRAFEIDFWEEWRIQTQGVALVAHGSKFLTNAISRAWWASPVGAQKTRMPVEIQ